MYQAEVRYTPELIRQAEKVINHTFYYMNNIVRTVLCILCMMAGVSVRQPAGTVLIFFGAVILTAGNMNGKRRADRTIASLNGQDVRLSYRFGDGADFKCMAQGNTSVYRYDSVIRLLEDAKFYYLFTGKDQIFLIRKTTVSEGAKGAFREFMVKKTGLEWTKPVTLFTFNIRQLFFNRRNTKYMVEE